MSDKEIKKIGIVAMFNLSAGGGAPRVTIDLVNALNLMGKKVYLMNPFNINFEKIKELYGEIKVEKIYSIGKLKAFFCRGRVLPRKIMKKEFQEMVKEVDFIIDLDGGIVHKYLPKNFDNSKYVIWRISCAKPASKRPWIKMNFKRKIKEKILDILGEKRCIPSKNYKIYAADKWTAKELKETWGIDSEENYLYPEIKVDELILKKGIKKEDQIVIFGRIAENKNIEDSMKIFAIGTKKSPEYNLVIIGGDTADSEGYIKKLEKLGGELNIFGRVKIIKNPSFEEIKKILQESKIIIDSQREISLTMTSIEAMAAGNVVIGYKNSGGYIDILENGKYGFGFLTIEEGGRELENVLKKLEGGKIDNKKMVKRAQDFSGERFKEALKEILNENGI